MGKTISPYYPPRAPWYSPLLQFGRTLRRRLWLDRIQQPEGISVRDFLGGLLVPGVGFFARGEKLIGWTIFIGCGLLAASFIVWLGYPFANVAFGLLISAHVAGVSFLLNPWFASKRLRIRLGFSLGLLAFIGLCVYAPLRSELQKHWLMPLSVHGHVVVVQRPVSLQSIKSGDWIMYSLEGVAIGAAHRDGGAVRAVAGFGLGPVLAVAGDRVVFSTNSFAVNGIKRQLLPHMPKKGDLVVPEKQWFIWPDLAISNPRNVDGDAIATEDMISATMLQLATVAETQFIGKPFKRWFWRHQILS